MQEDVVVFFPQDNVKSRGRIRGRLFLEYYKHYSNFKRHFIVLLPIERRIVDVRTFPPGLMRRNGLVILFRGILCPDKLQFGFSDFT